MSTAFSRTHREAFSVESLSHLNDAGLYGDLTRVDLSKNGNSPFRGPFKVSWKQVNLGFNSYYIGLKGGFSNYYQYYVALRPGGHLYPLFVSEESLLDKTAPGDFMKDNTKIPLKDFIDRRLDSEDSTDQKESKSTSSSRLKSFHDSLNHASGHGPSFLYFGYSSVRVEARTIFFVIHPGKWKPFQRRFKELANVATENIFTQLQPLVTQYVENAIGVEALNLLNNVVANFGEGTGSLSWWLGTTEEGALNTLRGINYLSGGFSFASFAVVELTKDLVDRNVGDYLRLIGNGIISDRSGLEAETGAEEKKEDTKRQSNSLNFTVENFLALFDLNIYDNLVPLIFQHNNGDKPLIQEHSQEKKHVYITYVAAEKSPRSRVYPLFIQKSLISEVIGGDATSMTKFNAALQKLLTDKDADGMGVLPMTRILQSLQKPRQQPTFFDLNAKLLFGFAGYSGKRKGRLFFVLLQKDEGVFKQSSFDTAYKNATKQVTDDKILLQQRSSWYTGRGYNEDKCSLALYARVNKYERGIANKIAKKTKVRQDTLRYVTDGRGRNLIPPPQNEVKQLGFQPRDFDGSGSDGIGSSSSCDERKYERKFYKKAIKAVEKMREENQELYEAMWS